MTKSIPEKEEFPELSDLADRLENEPESIATLSHLASLGDAFHFTTYAAYNVDTARRIIGDAALSHLLNEPVEQDRNRTDIITTLADTVSRQLGQYKRLREGFERGIGAIYDLRTRIPVDVNFQIDDEHSSTDFRSRYFSRVVVPKEQLDTLLKKDGFEIDPKAWIHRTTIRRISDGEEAEIPMPRLLAGTRVYEDDDTYVFESFSPLEGFNRRIGKHSIESVFEVFDLLDDMEIISPSYRPRLEE